jgi:hypothetical protein
MRRYLAVVFFSIFMMLVVTNAISSSDDFFTRDPEATYDKNYDNFDLVVEIPGHKLNPEIMPPQQKDDDYASHINPEILEKAEKYIEYRKINYRSDTARSYKIYAAKEFGNYILLYFTLPKITDGFFELIYSKKLKKIIGTFPGVIAG